MSRQLPTTTRSSEPDRIATTNIQGHWLVLMQIVLGILALFALLVFVVSLPVYAMQLQTLCRTASCTAGQLSQAAVQTLHNFGISVNSYVLFRLVNIVASALISFIVAGVLVWRKPRDWMALLVAFTLVMMVVVGTTNTVAGSPTVWRVPAKIISLLTYPTYFLVFMVFPNGRFVPHWIRWLLIPVFALSVSYTFFPNSLNSNIWFSLVGSILFVGLASTLPAIQIYRYWRVSAPLERQQTKWVVYGFILGFALGFGPYILTLIIPPLNQPGSLYPLIFNPDAGGTPLDILLPLSFGIAILRYRLWDIDILINRTLVYGALTVILTAIYVGLVIGLQTLLRGFINQDNSIAIVISTLAIAALFQPLRRRIQRIIDRRFYRSKYDAAKTLAAFSATLRNEVDLHELSEQLVTVVRETMQPSYVSLWLRQPTGTAISSLQTGKPSSVEVGVQEESERHLK
jgi:hypothetical protein